MIKKITVGITLLILLAGAGIIYFGLTQSSFFNKESEDEEQVVSTRELGTETEESEGIIEYEPSTERIVFQSDEEEAVKEIFKEQHDYLNSLAGWGAVERLDHSGLAEKVEWRQLKNDIEWLLNNGLAPSEAVNDMKNAQALMDVAEEHEDEMSVRYLHRIFHDIDTELNGTNVDKIWNVTYAFGTEEEIDKVYKYIGSLSVTSED